MNAEEFARELESLMKKAEENKNKEPKSPQTRYWAVVYTELEKTLAYVQTYLAS